MFTEIPSSQSQVAFRNDIQEDENYNIDTYEYLYNGGGVATADLNNDGLTDLVFSGNMTPSKIYINRTSAGRFVLTNTNNESDS